MKRNFWTLIFLILLVGATSNASRGQQSQITGIISSFDATTVKLYVHGEFVAVPKTAFEKNTKFTVGKEATAIVDIKR